MSATRSTLLLVRHGETQWNALGRLQGSQDIPLNATGRAQPAVVARTLREAGIDCAGYAFLSSPMARARETTRLLRAALDLDPDDHAVDERLAELSFGRWEGLTWKETRRLHPGEAAARDRDRWRFRPEGGESYADLAARVAAVLAEPRGPTLIVSHGGVMRAILYLLAGVAPARAVALDIWQDDAIAIAGGRVRWLRRDALD